MRQLQLILLPLLLCACAQFPELDASQSPGVAGAAFPALVPIESLLDGAAPRATPEMRAGVDGRVAGLRARAARLSGPVVDAQTRSRMRRGVSDPF
ncbi:hypothetical protein [Puniceibacterium sp. IMCC21224]|uniref:hypothetical protein n=1 Tax=Puniceibacterium sp. IMCC21224 TaxID=1618204 RepID=UPI00064D7427|nr:hypothetical protein [Puniceibacterium sp. IMCC21224]KMK66242.1 hypothetical protein IMCC21224_111090 [Puniceibacterium sp. IMCC21224]